MKILFMMASLALNPQIRADVNPAQCMALCSGKVEMWITDQGNDLRYALVVIDGPEYHESKVNMEENRRHYTVTFTHLPPGEYEVIAVVYDSTHEVARVRRTLNVV